jgi:vacuolar protein sorting-associated protein 53
MSKIDPLLKTLQVRPSPPEALVQAYLIHIADKSDTNFRKILDLKGLRKSDQTQLLDLFAAFRVSSAHENLVQNSPLLTPLMMQSASHIGTGIGSLGNAASVMGTPSLTSGRFDPAGFGNALMNAARDGVDRFGSPAPPAQQGTPDAGLEQKANLNENLKNIGKFFRRDVGGFRGFGRSEEGK